LGVNAVAIEIDWFKQQQWTDEFLLVG